MAFMRIFNGQKYYGWRRYQYKEDAMKGAKRIRAKGGKARVVRLSKGFKLRAQLKDKLGWEVFARGV